MKIARIRGNNSVTAAFGGVVTAASVEARFRMNGPTPDESVWGLK
jgi:hypothetical protein